MKEIKYRLYLLPTVLFILIGSVDSVIGEEKKSSDTLAIYGKLNKIYNQE